MSVILIRHGATEGNLRHAYIGCKTDEPLCGEGIVQLSSRVYPRVSAVYVSPMTRCVQTAALIYPDLTPIVVDDFRECDFGAFEGKNYSELNGRQDYQAWIDSGGEAAFPGGESRQQFASRCVSTFSKLNLLSQSKDAAVIAHGGTLMAIMESYAVPRKNYFDYSVSNGAGYILYSDGSWIPLSLPV